MGLISFNPVSWAESAVMAGFERAAVQKAENAGYSFFLTMLCELRTLPLVGKALARSGMAVYLNILRSGMKKKEELTVPDWYNDPANQARFATEKGSQ